MCRDIRERHFIFVSIAVCRSDTAAVDLAAYRTVCDRDLIFDRVAVCRIVFFYDTAIDRLFDRSVFDGYLIPFCVSRYVGDRLRDTTADRAFDRYVLDIDDIVYRVKSGITAIDVFVGLIKRTACDVDRISFGRTFFAVTAVYFGRDRTAIDRYAVLLRIAFRSLRECAFIFCDTADDTVTAVSERTVIDNNAVADRTAFVLRTAAIDECADTRIRTADDDLVVFGIAAFSETAFA
ncbi:MAG: hypothetical protein IIX11_06230 [Selenomonadales bacterium]|nr:hypothetical protein [Selenomonadales bacterium]